WASMKPGITVLPFALIVRPAFAAGAAADTDAILPSRTTTDPRSITRPVPSRILAFVIVRFCAKALQAPARTTIAVPIHAMYDLVFILPPAKATKDMGFKGHPSNTLFSAHSGCARGMVSAVSAQDGQKISTAFDCHQPGF